MGHTMFTLPGSSRWLLRFRRVLRLVCWAYLTVVLGVWLMLQWAEAWWPATILMFAPRWVFALPVAVLLPVVVLLRSRLAFVVLAAAGVVVWPVMGFNVPWQRFTASTPPGTPFRVLTLNMHYDQKDPAPLETLIADAGPDIVAVQEWHGWRRSELAAAKGWHTNGTSRLFLASHYPIRSAVELGRKSTSESASVTHYELDTPAGVLHVFSLHTATTRKGISDAMRDRPTAPDEVRSNSALRREQCENVARHAAECRGPVLVVGDFNTPPESPIFPEVWGGYTDAFSTAGLGWGYTFIGAKTTVRIDHILMGKGWHCTGCRVGPYVGSPHRPVIADLVWTGEKP